MPSSVPQTALHGQSRSSHDRLARGLGYFSIALGLTELMAPRALCRAVGLDGHDRLVQAYGVREVATGIAILMSHDATPWIWGRVAGDGADIATVLAASRSDAGRRGNPALALAALVGVTAVDVLCARGLSAEKGGPRTAVADYRDRTGFPHGTQAARGAARDFEIPRDMRTPDPLRPYTSRQQTGDGGATGRAAT